ncbi:hypothetical protein BHE74_00002669, partial [Ensete ventricosum]
CNHYGSSDVFSYPEDDTVEDPLLAEHLEFFGIDFSSLQKVRLNWHMDCYLVNILFQSKRYDKFYT